MYRCTEHAQEPVVKSRDLQEGAFSLDQVPSTGGEIGVKDQSAMVTGELDAGESGDCLGAIGDDQVGAGRGEATNIDDSDGVDDPLAGEGLRAGSGGVRRGKV